MLAQFPVFEDVSPKTDIPREFTALRGANDTINLHCITFYENVSIIVVSQL